MTYLGDNWVNISFGLDLDAKILLAASGTPTVLYAASENGVFTLPLARFVASLGQALAGPVGEDSAVTTVTITNRNPPGFSSSVGLLPEELGLEACDVELTFSRGVSEGAPVRLNGEQTSTLEMTVPQGGAASVEMTAESLAQGIISISTRVPCGTDSLSVSGSYLISGPTGDIKEAFTIRPNTAETWLTPGRCNAISTFQDPGGATGLGQDLGLVVSSLVPGQVVPGGVQLGFSLFDSEGQLLATDSLPVDGTHNPVFPLPPEIQGPLTALFCLEADERLDVLLDMTAVKVFSRGGFQFGSALFADTIDSGEASAWTDSKGAKNLPQTSEEVLVSTLGQTLAGAVGEDTALTNMTITNRDLVPCTGTLTFSQGASLGPDVLLNDQAGNSLALNIASGGVARVVMTAEELVQGIVSITAAAPCTASSLSVSGNYLISGPSQAIKEAFTIRPNGPEAWLPRFCNAITTYQDPTGEGGLGQDLGLAVAGTVPGLELIFAVVELSFYDSEGTLIGEDSIDVDGTHTAFFPFPQDLQGLITTLFCNGSFGPNGSLDMTAVKVFSLGGFQFGSALTVDNFRDGNRDNAWQPRNP